METDKSNRIFDIAVALINQSSRNIFLTGKAGTGKTTFLKHIRQHCPKQMAIVAPTGVAAINAGGSTIHSFLQLPFGTFIPEGKAKEDTDAFDRYTLLSRLRYSAEKRKLLQQLELLVIDEISMVRADTLDAVDAVLRHARQKLHEPFGGVQMLFIGDMFQLPPVVRDQDWKILSAYYDSPFFFDSQVIRQESPLYIEFDKVYRQRDENFVQLLNQVRNNELNEEGLTILEKRFNPGFHSGKEEYILLTTHNEIARRINLTELEKLPGTPLHYNAEVEGDFPETAFPADKELLLKTGAQVMFIRNDMAENGKRFFNGKIGVIKKLEKEKITVYCQDEEKDIEVRPEDWENIRYTLNKTSQTLEENVLGSFKQFPLRLAWAITIHKSQGLTFEKAVIDAGEAFAPGQVYVALSRCTNLEGMVLKSRIRKNSLFTDPRILKFAKQINSSSALEEELQRSKRAYQLKLLKQYFDLSPIKARLKEFKDLLNANKKSFREGWEQWLAGWTEKVEMLQETALKFHNWLDQEFNRETTPEQNSALEERIIRAAAHFIPLLDELIAELHRSPLSTDNREMAKESNDSLKQLFTDLCEKKHTLLGMDGHLDTHGWLERKKQFVLPPFQLNTYASQQKNQSPHPELHYRLRKCREKICLQKDLPVYLVAGTASIDEMATYLPHTPEELQLISGFGEKKAKSFGPDFLEIICAYAKEKGIGSLIHEKKEKRSRNKKTPLAKEKKIPSHDQTLELFLQGKGIREIAEIRALSASTIESHMAKLLEEKRIDILDLMPKDRYDRIMAAIEEKNEIIGLNALRGSLGEEYSYGELRMVLSAKKPFNE